MKPKSDAKRRAILEAAFAVVTEKGYFDTKVEEVARRAGVAKGTVYLYFEDKPAIYVGIVDWLLEQALAMAAEVRSRPLSPRRMLLEMFRVWTDGVFSRPVVVSLLSADAVGQSNAVMKRFRREVLPHIQELTDAIAAIIEQGIRAGEFRPVEPRLAATMYLSAFRAGMFAVANRLPVRDPATAVQELFFRGVDAERNGAARPLKPRSKHG